MNGGPVTIRDGHFVVTGAGPFSLGQAVADQLAATAAASNVKVLAIDAAPGSPGRSNVVPCRFDLNPLHDVSGYEAWSFELKRLVSSLSGPGDTDRPIVGVLLAAAKYHVGRFESTSPRERMDVLGATVLGNCEVLHAVMHHNATLGFDNADVLSVVDVGSLHFVRGTPHRALYCSAKAVGRALCSLLVAGFEVRSAVHVVPGPIDTPMLHWSHWVLRERGDANFLHEVRGKLPSLYAAIFRNGDSTALEAAIRLLHCHNSDGIREVFPRYTQRRKILSEADDGITTPEALGAYIAELMSHQARSESGVLEFVSPQGQLRVNSRPF